MVNLSVEDPSSHDGMIKISEKLIPFLPNLPSGRNQKTVLFGDQLYIERGKFSKVQSSGLEPLCRVTVFSHLKFKL